jgi:hypothetical protein
LSAMQGHPESPRLCGRNSPMPSSVTSD